MQQSAEPETFDDPVTVPVDDGLTKGRVSQVKTMSYSDRRAIKQLKILANKPGHYNAAAIAEYLAALPNVERILVLKGEGEVVGTVKIDALIDEKGKASTEKLEKLITTTETDYGAGLADEFNLSFSSAKIAAKSTLAEVYQFMLHNGLETVPATSDAGIYRSTFYKARLAEVIADRAILTMPATE